MSIIIHTCTYDVHIRTYYMSLCVYSIDKATDVAHACAYVCIVHLRFVHIIQCITYVCISDLLYVHIRTYVHMYVPLQL